MSGAARLERRDDGDALRGASIAVPGAQAIIGVSMIVARRFLIGGRVQGVGFRMFAAARAAAEGVHGYIQNLDDGRVEALVEGDDESVNRIELALRRGPAHARVDSFTVEDVAPTHRATGFSTR